MASDYQPYLAINANATTGVTEVVQTACEVKLIANDAVSNDLWVSFNQSTTAGNYIVLKPGECIKDWDNMFITKIYYRSSASTVAFRMLLTKSKSYGG